MLSFFKREKERGSSGRNYKAEKELNEYSGHIEAVIKDPSQENINALKNAGNRFVAAVDSNNYSNEEASRPRMV